MSGSIQARLDELGIELPDAPAPAANYVPWVRVGDIVYVSGQISRDDGGLITGKLGAELDVAAGAAAAETCALQLLAQVKAACGGDIDNLVRVVKLTGFVNSTADFTDQPMVVNGASDFLVNTLGDLGRHARSAVSAGSLPLGVAVEIEGIFSGQMIALPDQFLETPFAHRGLHDRSKRRPENSLAAIEAAVDQGYGVEMDVQLSGDGVAVVFHDPTLDRMTAETGQVSDRTAEELTRIKLVGSDQTIQSLATVLAAIDGRAPVLIEIKDQDGRLGPDIGPLERAVSRDVAHARGQIAAMSFNPFSVRAFGEFAPNHPRGLVTASFTGEDGEGLSEEHLKMLRDIDMFEMAGASFVSHEVEDLQNPALARIKTNGAPILCWTVRSPETEIIARQVADNITFEGYLAAHRAT